MAGIAPKGRLANIELPRLMQNFSNLAIYFIPDEKMNKSGLIVAAIRAAKAMDLVLFTLDLSLKHFLITYFNKLDNLNWYFKDGILVVNSNKDKGTRYKYLLYGTVDERVIAEGLRVLYQTNKLDAMRDGASELSKTLPHPEFGNLTYKRIAYARNKFCFKDISNPSMGWFCGVVCKDKTIKIENLCGAREGTRHILKVNELGLIRSYGIPVNCLMAETIWKYYKDEQWFNSVYNYFDAGGFSQMHCDSLKRVIGDLPLPGTTMTFSGKQFAELLVKQYFKDVCGIEINLGGKS